MITQESFSRCNFTVWFHDTEKNSYIFQMHRGLGAEHTHAGMLGHDVLIINNDKPIKVSGIEEAVAMADQYESKNNLSNVASPEDK